MMHDLTIAALRFSGRLAPWIPVAAGFALASAGTAVARPDVAALGSEAAIASAEGPRLTLSAAVARALEEGFAAKIARLEAARADDTLGETRGAYLPHLFVSTKGGWSNQINEKLVAVNGQGVVKKYGLANIGNDPWISVLFEQSLLDLGQWRRIEQEELAAEAAHLAEARAREAIAYEVTRRYAGLLRLESLARDASARVAQAQWLDDQAKLLLEAGRALASERDRVAIHLAEAEMGEQSLESQIADGRASLWIAIGSEEEPRPWPALVPESLPEPDLEHLPEASEEAVLANPELRILDLQRRIDEAGISAARARRYPTVQLSGGYNHYGIKRFDNFDDEAFVFLGLQLPIFDGFQTSSAIAASRKGADIARLRYQSMLQSKRARVLELARRLDTAGRRAVLAERRAAAAREEQRLADLNLQAQRVPLALALATRERSAQESSDAIDAHFEQFELWAALQREMGRIAAAVAPDAPAAAP